MIERERLEELIEQGATIYEVKYGKINPVSLKNKIRFISEKYPVIVFEPRPNEKYKHHKYFDKLFETLKEAEWHREFGCIERTERLVLPIWEEFDKNGYVEFAGKDGTKLVLEKTLTIDFDREPISDYVLEILINDYNHSLLFEAEYTKENYTLACVKAKELFLGD